LIRKVTIIRLCLPGCSGGIIQEGTYIKHKIREDVVSSSQPYGSTPSRKRAKVFLVSNCGSCHPV
jgi:hypothetical protein